MFYLVTNFYRKTTLIYVKFTFSSYNKIIDQSGKRKFGQNQDIFIGID
jgi:hypothetical protein